MSEAKQRLFRSTRREALIVLAFSFAALTWVVGFCYLRGYRHDPDSWLVRNGLATSRSASELTTVLGFPDWVFWGIILPWIACSLFTFLFGMFFMSDDDLTESAKGDAADES